MRGDKYLKLVLYVLCGVVASYLIFSAVRGSGSDYTTYKAVLYEVGDGISTSGFVVRQEELVTGAHDIVVLTRAEGERVGAGQSVAATYRDRQAMDRQSTIDHLEKELAQMEAAYSFSGSEAESATLDSDIVRLMNQVTLSASRRDYAAASESAEQLKAGALRRYITKADAESLWERISAAQEQLSELYAQAKSESGEISVSRAGWFSGQADGYENVLTPAALETMSVEEFEAAEPVMRPSDTVGRLVTDARWYYAAVVDTADVRDLQVGDRVEVSFAYDFYNSVQMELVRIGASSSGSSRSLVVLASDRYIQDAVSSRAQNAELIFAYRSGLRVPDGAIYVNDEGQSGVYVLEGAEARWKDVEVIYYDGENYIVTLDQSSTDNLWPEDEIILTTQNMYEGKVMIR